MSVTRTGSFPIGFRTHGGWQEDLSVLIRWAVEQDFTGVDVGALEVEKLKQIVDGGLRIGTVDLMQPFTDLVSPDASKRKDGAQRNAELIKSATALGVRNFFAVMFPEDEQTARRDSLRLAAEGYGLLCDAIASTGAKIVLEGYPGGAPHFSALACTPESYRAVFNEIGSDVMGVNFDPSHLLRMGIDPVRFCREFTGRIHHVHAKDTQLLADDLYEYGTTQPATLGQPYGFGGHYWRYTIPGHGVTPWGELFAILSDAGYQGMVSIELEDENFNGTEEGEKRGLTASRDFLVHA